MSHGHNDNLINPLLSSLAMLHDPGSYGTKGSRLTSSAIFSREPQESLFNRDRERERERERDISSSFHLALKRADSRSPDENELREDKHMNLFEKPYLESKISKESKLSR
jgi:hypothetical protein